MAQIPIIIKSKVRSKFLKEASARLAPIRDMAEDTKYFADKLIMIQSTFGRFAKRGGISTADMIIEITEILSDNILIKRLKKYSPHPPKKI